MHEINWHPSRKDLNVFSALLIPFCAVVALLIYKKTGNATPALAVLVGGTLLGVAGLCFPRFMRWIYVAWMVAVFPLGWLISHIVLAAVFFLVVTPVGLLMRLLGADPMQRGFDRHAPTYWQPRPASRDSRRYFRQF